MQFKIRWAEDPVYDMNGDESNVSHLQQVYVFCCGENKQFFCMHDASIQFETHYTIHNIGRSRAQFFNTVKLSAS